jgi:c-di-GMP-binding flagellar brake protein YcgR
MRLFSGLRHRLIRLLEDDSSEQRDCVRVEHALLATVRPRGPTLSRHVNENRGVTENISRKGIKIRAFRHLPVSADVELEMRDSLQNQPIHATGAVVWAAPLEEHGHWLFGIQFADINDEMQERLEGLIQAALEQDAKDSD